MPMTMRSQAINHAGQCVLVGSCAQTGPMLTITIQPCLWLRM